MNIIVWIAWYWDGSQIVKYVSSNSSWRSLPSTGFLAARVIYDQKYDEFHHYSDICYGNDYVWLASDGRIYGSNVKPTGVHKNDIKEGVAIADETWETFRMGTVHSKDAVDSRSPQW